MAVQIPNPIRVVCTKCLAVAVVHYQDFLISADRVLIWLECHGEHRFAEIDGELVAKVLRQGGDIPFHGLVSLRSEHVQTMLENTERQMIEVAERMGARVAALTGFLKATG